MGTGNRAFRQAIEKTQNNIKWLEHNKDIIASWLKTVGTPQERVKDVRLPTHLEPVTYDLYIKPNMYEGDPENFNFEGSVKIHMVARSEGKNVTVHSNKLDILENSIRFGTEDSSDGPSYNGIVCLLLLFVLTKMRYFNDFYTFTYQE